MDEKLVVVSLEEEKSKEIAKILTNDTSRKILDRLSEKRMSITELNKELNVPISTIQYNIDALKDAGFIKETAYRYSEKGKKVIYYEPERKIILLAPKTEEKESILKRLKLFLGPLVLGLSSLASFYFAKGTSSTANVLSSVAEPVTKEAATTGAAATVNAAPLMADACAATQTLPGIIYNPYMMFLSGFLACFALLSLAIIIWRMKYGKK